MALPYLLCPCGPPASGARAPRAPPRASVRLARMQVAPWIPSTMMGDLTMPASAIGYLDWTAQLAVSSPGACPQRPYLAENRRRSNKRCVSRSGRPARRAADKGKGKGKAKDKATPHDARLRAIATGSARRQCFRAQMPPPRSKRAGPQRRRLAPQAGDTSLFNRLSSELSR